MRIYAVVYGSRDLTDETIEQKFGALCLNLASALKEKRRIAAETHEPTGILVFTTEWVDKGCFILNDTIEG